VPIPERIKAPLPDLRLARIEVFQTFAVDMSDLFGDGPDSIRTLQELRAHDAFPDSVVAQLVARMPDCRPERDAIQDRMDESLRMKGKAVWTDHFLDRYAPVILPHERTLKNHADRLVVVGNRLSGDSESPLHYIKFSGSHLKLFRDGTLTYTVGASFTDQCGHEFGSLWYPIASIAKTIERIEAFEEITLSNLRNTVKALVDNYIFRSVISDAGLRLRESRDLTNDLFRRRAKSHRLLFVERFFDGVKVNGLYPDGPSGLRPPDAAAEVPLEEVLSSSSFAGLLNTASWYDEYNTRYVNRLSQKDIGYRVDEIYLTDRHATVACNRGFWRIDPPGAEPLSRYKWDLILAVEYNVARVAYFSAALTYYQDHPDVRGLEEAPPVEALRYIIDGRAILANIDQSLDLSLLVDHGFTRLFITRLRRELGLEVAFAFIRQRVEDASATVALKSSVVAAEQTSVESLRTAIESLQAAMVNNRIQRTILLAAILSAVIGMATLVLALTT
jgi:hypothetical protein